VSDIRGWMPIPIERRMSRSSMSTKEDEKNMPAEFKAAEEPHIGAVAQAVAT